MHRHAWGIHPKNIYQAMALQALLDTDMDLVILTGPAGCGKTLIALAAALELVIEKGQYEKVIVTRNTPEIAESIGFLPGTEEEKMAPWLAAITDSLEVLHKTDEHPHASVSYIMDKANIQFKSVNFMRGRSIQNAIVILYPSICLADKLLLPRLYWARRVVTRILVNNRNFTKHSANADSFLLHSDVVLGEVA